MSDPSAPIGVFDSGVGGLTVVRELRAAMPSERIVYLGDTARVPYGTRTAATVRRYAEGCAGLLVSRGVKALVVACNTASAVAVDSLKAHFSLPVFGVVQPGARAAVDALAQQHSPQAEPELGAIGLLCTAGTVRSGAYERAIRELNPSVRVVAQAAPLLVPLAEEGWLEGEVPELVIKRYLAPVLDAGARVLLLGCTHYPLLAPLISIAAEQLSGQPLPIVDSAAATARAVRLGLHATGLLKADGCPGELSLLATDLPYDFESGAERFLGGPPGRVTQVDIAGGDHPA